MKKIFYIISVILFCIVQGSFAQVSGPTSVCQNTVTYTYYAPYYSGATYTWTLPSGVTKISQTDEAIVVRFTGSGNLGSFQVRVRTVIVDEYHFSGNISTRVPNAGNVGNQTLCGPITITPVLTGNSNITFLGWQRFNGTSWTDITASDLQNVANTYQYRAKVSNICDPASILYSSAGTITISSNSSSPTVTGNVRFGSGTLIMSATGTPAGGSYRWYSPTNTLLATGSTYTTPTLTASTTNYLSVRTTNSSGCEGPIKTIDVTINPLPIISTTQPYIVLGNPVTLNCSGPYDSYAWKNTSNVVVGTGPAFTTSTKGNYTVTVTKNGASIQSNPFLVSLQFENLNENFIVVNDMQIETVVNASDVYNIDVALNSQRVQYFDGLGRASQDVLTMGSGLRKDIVKPITYDDFGRESRAYLPFIASEANGRLKDGILNLQGGYSGIASGFYTDARPFSETVYEPSPLSRPQAIIGTGENWINKPTQLAYPTNINGTSNGQERIIIWTLNEYKMPVADISVNNGFYPSGALEIKSVKDENGHEVREYLDKFRRVILKKVFFKGSAQELNNLDNWALTYYVYDDHGSLVFVLPPEAVISLLSQN